MATYKTAILGPEDVVSGFRALGVETMRVDSGEELIAAITSIKAGMDQTPYAVVLVTEKLAASVPEDEWMRLTSDVLPTVVSLPGLEGSNGQGVRALKRLAERAIGSDILG